MKSEPSTPTGAPDNQFRHVYVCVYVYVCLCIYIYIYIYMFSKIQY